MDGTKLIEQYQERAETVYQQVTVLHHNREIWRYFNDELPKRGGGRGTVHKALTRWYLDSQASALRRIASSRNRDNRSLHKLLTGVRANLQAFTPSHHGVAISDEIVGADLQRLVTSTKNVTRWADEQVAHIGQKQSAMPTFTELDNAIEAVGALVQKYYQLLDGGHRELTPVIPSDWRAPFQKAWQ